MARTERGRRAQWTAAVILAPGAAAMFGATTAWAEHTTPTTPATPASAVSSAVLPPRPPAVDNAGILRDQRRHAAELDDQLQAVTAQLRRAHTHRVAEERATRVAAAAAASGSNQGPTSYQQPQYQTPQYQAPAAQYQPPVVQYQAPPAPAPPAHGSTGASGTVK